jgi:hypothetical protein
MHRIMFWLLAASCLCEAQSTSGSSKHSSRTIEDVARIATVMLDGDVCTHIQTRRSIEYMSKKNPRDPWIASDNYDVNDGPFIQTKKTLMRLAQLCPAACDVNLWMRVPARPDRIQIVIRNVHEISQFWKWGDMDQEMPPEMKRVLDTAEPVTVRQKPGMTSVLAPVYDSLRNVTALVEVVSENNPDPRENVK